MNSMVSYKMNTGLINEKIELNPEPNKQAN